MCSESLNIRRVRSVLVTADSDVQGQYIHVDDIASWGAARTQRAIQAIDALERCGAITAEEAIDRRIRDLNAQHQGLGEFRTLVEVLVDNCAHKLTDEQFMLAGRLLNLIDGKA